MQEKELTLATELFPGTVREVMKMAGKRREPIDIEANLRYIADWLGPEPLLAGLSPQERLAGLSPEELLTALGEEERHRLRELLLQEEAAVPRLQPQGKSGTSRRAPGRRRG